MTRWHVPAWRGPGDPQGPVPVDGETEAAGAELEEITAAAAAAAGAAPQLRESGPVKPEQS